MRTRIAIVFLAAVLGVGGGVVFAPAAGRLLDPASGVASSVAGPGIKAPDSVAGPAVAANGVRPGATDALITGLQDYLRGHPGNAAAYAALGQAFLQHIRETADPTFYPRADEALRRALSLDPTNADAVSGLGLLALARHEFTDALAWGRRGQQLNPDDPGADAIVGDAEVELGQYPQAFATFQARIDKRPDLPSYARVSYARELRGDLPGAIRAMVEAVSAGQAGSEGLAWADVQLGNLYFNSGNETEADAAYTAALVAWPNYPAALAGQANLAAARGDLETAIAIDRRAVAAVPLPQYVIALGDFEARAGHAADAQADYKLVQAEEELYQANGVDVDGEIALFDADHHLDIPSAVGRARAAYARRPSITVADILAWTLHVSGDDRAAQVAMRQALSLGTRNALMDYHAATIAYALGQTSQARAYLTAALSLNPHFSILYSDQARVLLAKLEGSTTGRSSGSVPVIGSSTEERTQ